MSIAATDRASSSSILVRSIATFGFIGHLPLAPGTWASAVTLGLWYLLKPHGLPLIIGGGVALLIVGTWAAHRAESIYGHDSSHVVIDEVAGSLIAVAGLTPHWYAAVGGFILFRFFDIVKPPPIYQLQAYRGGYGVMADDVAAGVASNIVLRAALIVIGRLTGGL